MISEEVALGIAQEYSKKMDWFWRDPVRVDRRNHFWGPLYSYLIITGANGTGCNIRIEIEAKSGRIIKGGFIPR